MDDTTVKVAVRVRPQSARELLDMCQVCSHVVPGDTQIILGNDKSFTFDHVLVPDAIQKEVYETCCAELIEGTFEGYNATILAYGQTGSGKTYTMGTGFDVNMLPEQVGIIPRAVKHLFDGIEQRKSKAVVCSSTPPDFKVNAQFMELYNEEINDLLDSTRETTEKCKKSLIRIHEDANGGIYTVGATTRPVSSLEDTMECLKIGALLRSTGSTHMNVQSSRSHAIFTLHIRQQRTTKEKFGDDVGHRQHVSNSHFSSSANILNMQEYKDTNLNLEDGSVDDSTEIEMLSAKFHFVDLAGSERLKRTGATGDRAKEGISINCGLLALGNVISALGVKAKRGTHVPYRDSKLTRLLQDSLGGNSRTLMIACVSPSDRDFVETLNTLKYANRARNIKNKVSVNQDMSSKQLSALRAEVQALQRELMEYKLGRKSMESSLSSMSALQSQDMTLENQLLTKEIESMRQRVKSLQQTVESLTMRNIQLIVDRDTAFLSLNDGILNENAQKLIENYIKDSEDLRVKLVESEFTLETVRNSLSINKHLISPSNLQTFNASPDEHLKEVLNIAQKDLDALRNKFQLKSLSQEGCAATGDENDNEETDMIEEDLKETDDELSENENPPTPALSNLANLTSEISIKEKLVEELKMTQMRMKTIQVQYEEKMKNLEEKIRETQWERDKVIASLENIESNSEEKSKKIKEEYEKRLSELRCDLKKLESANKSHMKMLKDHSAIEKHYKTVQQELLDLKKQKVHLMNKMKEDAQRNRQLELQRDKEINQLRKSQRMKDNQIKTMEAERKQKEIVLKRKQEEVESLRKRNRPVMSARAFGQMKNDKEISACESMRPRRPSKFPDKSSKVIWNDIEKSITSLVSKKQMLACLEKDMDRWIKQRNRLRKKLEALQGRSRTCESDDDTKNHIRTIESSISYAQENILSCQTNIMQLEEGKEEDGDPLKRLSGCSSSQLKYLLEYSINSLISKDLTLIEKDAENKELSAKLHQYKMDSTYQRDVLQILIQDKENIDIDESLLSPRKDSDEEDNDEDEEEISEDNFRKDYFITSSTPIRQPEEHPLYEIREEQKSLEANSSPAFDFVPLGKREKARRKTSTPEELLFVKHGNQIFEAIVEDKALEQEYSDKTRGNQDVLTSSTGNCDATSSKHNLKTSESKFSNYFSRLNQNASNSKKINSKQTEQHQIPKKKPLSASSSLGSDTFSKAGSVVSSATDSTPPTSPINSKKTKEGGTSNVFSRLYGRDHFNSPYPAKGAIKISSGKSNQHFPLTHCFTADGHAKAVLSIFSTDSLLFSGSKDRTAKMWDLGTGEDLMTMGVHLNNVVSVKYSECSGLVYTASTYLIKLWDPRCGGVCIKSLMSSGLTCDNANGSVTRSHTCPQGESSIADICISTSANNLYSAVGNYVKIWDMRMLKIVGKLCGGHQAAVMALAIDDTDTADGNTCIVTGSKDHYIKVYEVMDDVTGSVVPKYNLEPPHYDGIQSLCLKGDFLFSGSRDTCIKKWDLAGQQLKQSINNAHKDWICGLTFLPSENCLLSACRAGVMKVWNVDNCSLVGEIQAHSSPINDITSNSQMIFSASNDKSIQFWKPKENLELLDLEIEF